MCDAGDTTYLICTDNGKHKYSTSEGTTEADYLAQLVAFFVR